MRSRAQMLDHAEENFERKRAEPSKSADDDPNGGGKVGRDRLRRGSLRGLRSSGASSDAHGARQRCLHNAGAVSTEPQQRDIVIDMLFGSGVPLLLVPANWNKPGPIRKAIVAWDGGASAARAVRDALPLLADAEMVEVVSVLGEKDIAAEASGADIARHLARHCREVSVNVLPVREDGVAATLFAHGILTRADLMVMGGYGHSRLREFVLGGVTRDTLARTDIPTLLSH